MSYSVEYLDPKTNEPYVCEPFWEGGTYKIEGNRSTELNITYNYSNFYYDCLDRDEGLRWLYGKTGKECHDRLYQTVKSLGIDRYEGSWYIIDSGLLLKAITSAGELSKEQEEWLDLYGEEFKAREKEVLDPSQLEDSRMQEAVLEGIRIGILKDTGGYWCPTPGNAGFALNILFQWALRFPEGVFRGD